MAAQIVFPKLGKISIPRRSRFQGREKQQTLTQLVDMQIVGQVCFFDEEQPKDNVAQAAGEPDSNK